MAKLCPFFDSFLHFSIAIIAIENLVNTISREPLELGFLYLA